MLIDYSLNFSLISKSLDPKDQSKPLAAESELTACMGASYPQCSLQMSTAFCESLCQAKNAQSVCVTLASTLKLAAVKRPRDGGHQLGAF